MKRFANRWLFGGLIFGQLATSPTTNAILRTTTAATIFEGGVKDNILPARARAIVNFRIKPGDTVDDVLAHVAKVVNDRRQRRTGGKVIGTGAIRAIRERYHHTRRGREL